MHGGPCAESGRGVGCLSPVTGRSTRELPTVTRADGVPGLSARRPRVWPGSLDAWGTLGGGCATFWVASSCPPGLRTPPKLTSGPSGPCRKAARQRAAMAPRDGEAPEAFQPPGRSRCRVSGREARVRIPPVKVPSGPGPKLCGRAPGLACAILARGPRALVDRPAMVWKRDHPSLIPRLPRATACGGHPFPGLHYRPR